MSCNCNGSDTSGAVDCTDSCPSTCGSQTFVSNCTCNSTCGCQVGSAATAVPYYNAAEACEEAHSRVCIQNQYVTGVSISNSITMPACNQTTVLTIPGLQLININSYLWHPIYGYLLVVSFDFPSSTVVVKNECQSVNVAPGTPIPACTIFTVVDTAFIATDPCTTTAVADGALVVCDGENLTTLDATSNGQVPVVIDHTTNTVEFQTLDTTERLCTELTVDLILVMGNPGPYLINVTTTAFLSPGDLLQINGRTDRFTVTGGITPNTFLATVAPVPAAGETIPAGVSVCQVLCCEQLDSDLTVLTTVVNNFIGDPCSWDLSDRFSLGTAGDSGVYDNPVVGIHVGDPIVWAPVADILLTNPTCRTMSAFVTMTWNYLVEFMVGLVDPHFAQMKMYAYYAATSGLIGTTVPPAPTPVGWDLDDYAILNNVGCQNPLRRAQTYNTSHSFAYSIASGNELRVAIRAGIAMLASATPGDEIAEINLVSARLDGIKVAF